MKINHLIFLACLFTLISCSKDKNDKLGYYNIESLTNSLDVPIKVEIGRVTKKLSNDLDFNKNLSYRTLAVLPPKKEAVLDSTFICTAGCESFLTDIDPEMHPLFIRITIDNKIKQDTNCRHIYVTQGLIKNCQANKKNFFDKKYWTINKDDAGNSINKYIIDNNDLTAAQ